ncbi:hypothetical protein [Tessaracoccus massiliensis]|uniref:hypothetical protein n=1 Tax=Tessaracoccus massiliensis TaxID=1522311 RepID=UPI00058E52E4|nr:hypothetical protein [Tessaracoccus massiliensis]
MIGRGRGQESWRLHVVDGDELPIVEGSGSDDWQESRPSPHGMTVQLREHPGDLRGALLRGTYRCAKGAWTIGTWVPTGLTRAMSSGPDIWTLSAVDPTVRLARIHLRRSYTLPTGGDIEAESRRLLETYLPGVPLAIVDTDATARVPLTWEVGTPLLTALSEMLAAGGHEPVRPTRDGGYAAPLIGAPGGEPVVEWADDRTRGQFVPELELTDRLLDVPNEVLAIAAGSGSTQGLVGRWVDLAAIKRYGRHTDTIRVEATSQTAADAQAAKRGRDLQAQAAELTLTAPWEPVDAGSLASLTWTEREVEKRAIIRGWSHTWAPSAETAWTLQEVR